MSPTVDLPSPTLGIKLPDPTVAISLDDLAAVQRIADSHVTFSLTMACPLRCSHCIVDAAPERRDTTMPLDVARGYAGQMAALAADGVRSISFTGGEPTVAVQQLRVLSAAAHDACLISGVVTAAPWARTEGSARRLVASLPGIQCWDISLDAYHLEFVTLDVIRTAYDALLAAKKRVTIRFAYQEPLDDEDRRILAYIDQLDQAAVTIQRVRPVGRGLSLDVPVQQRYNPWVKPCLTQGFVVRYDTSISPCCLNLVESRRHPFQFGDATARPLVEIRRDYLAQPLLQLIRAIGFAELWRWIQEAGLDSSLPEVLPEEACEVCELFMKNPRIAGFLMDKVSQPEMQLKIGVLTLKSLGEAHMLREVLRRLEPNRDAMNGYDDALAFLQSETLSGVS